MAAAKDKYSDAFIDYLADRYSLNEASMGRVVKLGHGACPLCGEERQDLRIYVEVDTTKGWCHHCERGFNAIKFVMAYEQCGYKQALSILDGSGSSFVRTFDEPAKPDMTWPVLRSVFDFPQVKAYLNARNVSDEMIDQYQLRFCTDDLLVKVGDDVKVYKPSNRIIVPIFDEFGNPVGWQGRDITDKSKIKYLFAPGFDAGLYLYDYHAVDPTKGFVILTEGVFHVFGWKRFGVPNVVGTFGKKLSDGQLDLLLKIKPRLVYLAWDSDAKWQKAEFCEKYGHLFKILIIDLNGKDSDEVDGRCLHKALVEARAYSWKDKILARM